MSLSCGFGLEIAHRTSKLISLDHFRLRNRLQGRPRPEDSRLCPCSRCQFTVSAKRVGLALPPLPRLRILSQAQGQNIYTNYDKGNLLWQKHRGDLWKIYSKMTVNKRKSLLRRALRSNIAGTRRSEFAYLRGDRATTEAHIPNAAIIPHLNVDDLADADKAFMLLDARFSQLPGAFARLDLDNANMSTEGHDPNNEYGGLRILLLNQPAGRYGLVVPSAEAGDADLGLPPAAAYNALLIQIQVYKVLLLFMCAILGKRHIKETQLRNLPGQARPPIDDKRSDWPTVHNLTTRLPYSTPPQDELVALGVLVSAQYAEALRHLFSLRDNQGYLSEELQSWEEHFLPMAEYRANLTGRAKSSILMSEMLTQGFQAATTFGAIAASVRAIEQHLSAGKSSANAIALTQEREDLLALLDVAIQRTCEKWLAVGILQSPEMRRAWKSNSAHKADDDVFTLFHAMLSSKATRNHQKVWDICEMLADGRKRSFFRPLNIMAEFQDLFDTEPGFANKIDSWLLQFFSELGVLFIVEQQVSMVCPTEAPSRYSEGLAQANRLHSTVERLVDRFCSRQTAKLDNFEDFFDRLAKTLISGSGEQLKYISPTLNELYAQGDFLRLGSQGKTSITSADNGTEVVQGNAAQSSQSGGSNANDSEPGSAAQYSGKGKEKVKTVGIPGPAAEEPDQPEVEQEEEQPAPIQVGKRHYETFEKLFSAGHEGLVDWNDFCKAMTAAGFQSQTMGGGSSRLFRHEDLKPISFHAPHPSSEISRNKSMHMARDLGRVYGWTLDSFAI